MNVAQETLGFRRGSLSLPLSLLMSAFALLIPPATLTGHLRRPTERSPTTHAFPLIHSQSPSRDRPSVVARGASRRATNLKLRRSGHSLAQPAFLGACEECLENELKWNARIRIFGAQFEPRYIFRAGRLDQ